MRACLLATEEARSPGATLTTSTGAITDTLCAPFIFVLALPPLLSFLIILRICVRNLKGETSLSNVLDILGFQNIF